MRFSSFPRALALAVLVLVVPACSDGDTGPQGPPGVVSISAGDGLLAAPDPIVGTGTLSVDFGGSGVTTAVARADHHHDAAYLQLGGGTLSGGLTVGGNVTVNGGGVLSGDGSGLSALNAASLSSGTLPDARLGGSYTGSVALSNTSNTFTGSFTFGTPVTRYLSVPATAFRAVNGSALYEGYPGLSASAGEAGAFVAPVLLPHGAQITAIDAIVLDNYDSGSAGVFLAREDAAGALAAMAGVATGNAFANPAPQTLAMSAIGGFSFPLGITNDTHAYSLLFQHGSSNPALSFQLFRVRITYTILSPLP